MPGSTTRPGTRLVVEAAADVRPKGGTVAEIRGRGHLPRRPAEWHAAGGGVARGVGDLIHHVRHLEHAGKHPAGDGVRECPQRQQAHAAVVRPRQRRGQHVRAVHRLAAPEDCCLRACLRGQTHGADVATVQRGKVVQVDALERQQAVQRAQVRVLRRVPGVPRLRGGDAAHVAAADADVRVQPVYIGERVVPHHVLLPPHEAAREMGMCEEQQLLLREPRGSLRTCWHLPRPAWRP